MSRLLLGLPLQVTKHDWGAERFGKPTQLVIDHEPQFVDILLSWRLDPYHIVYLPLTRAPVSGALPDLLRRADGDTVKPVGQALPPGDRASLPREHEESHLESVVRVVGIDQDPATDPKHHRPVSLDHGREGILGRVTMARQEPLQELRIAERPDHAVAEQCRHIAEHSLRPDRHESVPRLSRDPVDRLRA